MSRATQVPPCLWTGFRVRGCHPLWRAFPRASAILSIWRCRRSYYPGRCLDTPGLGWGAFARHYSRHHFCFLFLRVLRCFSSPGSPAALRHAGIASGGLPHSDIRGSRDICSSPRLFAAYHVLHRLREPRHPSCALLSFPFSFWNKSLVIVTCLLRLLFFLSSLCELDSYLLVFFS